MNTEDRVQEEINKIMEKANIEQQEAIKHRDGACMIIAGPGSGKTFTVISRTKYMILQGVAPYNICCFTFTNKAANEMKERIRASVGDLADQITCGTYHSIAYRILRQYADKLDYSKNFSIISNDDYNKLIKKIAKERNLEEIILSSYISKNKDSVILPNEALLNAKNSTEVSLANAYEEYQKELKRQMAMDFDDLILNCILLLEKYPDIKSKINNKWKYITADEAHDSSIKDLRFIKLLGGDAENVCFILDDNQSIYSFRGADIEAVMNTRYIYKNMKIYNLSNNYRCSQTIVEASKTLIDKNTKLIDKQIRAAREYQGTPIIISETDTPKIEAFRVVTNIKALKLKGIAYKDIAVLYRMSSASRIIEQALNEHHIKYRIIGGTPFFQRAEIQDIISYLKFLVNDYDFMAFKRCIAVPKRGIGEKALEKINDYIINYPGGPLPLRSILRDIPLKGKSKAGLDSFLDYIDQLEIDSVNLSLPDLLNKMYKDLNILDYIQHKSEYKDNWEERVDNLKELIELSRGYNEISDLLTQASLDTSEDDSEENDAVNLLTLHSSKGLEYKAVIIVNCNEGTSPHYRSLGSLKALEEERRLFYVGMTRAKDFLFLTYSKTIMMQGRLRYAKPSRFLNEIDSKYIYRN